MRRAKRLTRNQQKHMYKCGDRNLPKWPVSSTRNRPGHDGFHVSLAREPDPGVCTSTMVAGTRDRLDPSVVCPEIPGRDPSEGSVRELGHRSRSRRCP